jgi:hypothetical protein
VKLGHVAFEGTQVKANASQHKAMSYDRMKKREAKLQGEVEWLAAAEAADAEEDKLHGADLGTRPKEASADVGYPCQNARPHRYLDGLLGKPHEGSATLAIRPRPSAVESTSPQTISERLVPVLAHRVSRSTDGFGSLRPSTLRGLPGSGATTHCHSQAHLGAAESGTGRCRRKTDEPRIQHSRLAMLDCFSVYRIADHLDEGRD